MYWIGLGADRLHAQRTVKEPEGQDVRPKAADAGHSSFVSTASGSVTVRGLPHSAGYYAWQLRVRTRQYREAHHYARVLERYIRARRHPAPTRTLSSSSPWDSVAACESGGNWAYNGSSGFEGGLQFLNSTWIAHGGGRYAAHAYDATREQQIAIAERVLAASGWGQWPACSAKLGLR